MTLETTVNDLTLAVTTLTTSVQDKRTVLDNAAQQAATSLTTTQGLQTQAAASAATAAAKATEATNNATQIAAYKTAAAALDTSTTATAAVTNLLPDLLAKKDPARHPFRKKMPTLVLDFERQKCHRYSPSTGFGETPLNTFMTFARNSAATYTGPDGLLKTAAANEARYDYDPLTGECKGLLVEEQRTNLLPYSKWVTALTTPVYKLGAGAYPTIKPNSGVAPDGTLTASRVFLDAVGSTSGDRSALLFNPAIDGVVRTCSVYLRSATTQSYTIGIRLHGVLSGFLVTPTSWTRVIVTASDLADNTGYLCAVYGAVSASVTTSKTADILVWGAQLEVGAFPTSYIPTPAVFSARASTATYLDANGVVQTAASGVARSNAYDYDSDGVLRPIGLLLEASATNQLLYSEQFDNSAWNKNAVGVGSAPVVTANYGTAPDGTNTADRIVFALNGGLDVTDRSELRQYVNTIAGSSYVQSIWLKTTDGSTKTIQISFDAEAPKLLTITGTWQRFSNVDPAASDTIRGFRLCLRGATGTSDSADLLVWGAQQGVGSYPTSYIPTTTAQVTRAADTATSAQATRVADDAKVDGTKFSDFYNQVQGTLVCRGYLSDTTAGSPLSRTLATIAGALDNFRIGSSSMAGAVLTNNSVQEAGSGALWGVSVGGHAFASRVKKDAFAITRDGATVTTDNTCATPRVDSLRIGTTGTNSGVLNGHVAHISYYPQPFTNEELQAATSA